MTKIKQILKKKAVIAALFFITALAGFLIFAWNYEIPLPFDEYRMSVEVRPAVVVTDDEGRVGLKEIDDEELEEYQPEWRGCESRLLLSWQNFMEQFVF